jgi:hypothetical protein
VINPNQGGVMSKERELLERASGYLCGDLPASERGTILNEIEAYLSEPVQNPEPVAWMWQSDDYATRFSQRVFELKAEADDMRTRYGGELYPLYFIPPSGSAKLIIKLEKEKQQWVDAVAIERNERKEDAKRISDLEGELEAAEQHVKILRKLNDDLQSRINNGVRVSVVESYGDGTMIVKQGRGAPDALLLLDEKGRLEMMMIRIRKYIAIKLLGFTTWVLPAQHPAILTIYAAAAKIDEQGEGG